MLPVTDNVNGVYSRPIEARLKENIEKNHQYIYIDSKFSGALVTPQDLEDNPAQVKSISEGLDADAIICMRANKSQTGVTLHMDMFLKKDGTLIAQQILRDQPQYETTQIQEKTAQMLERLTKQIPYDGIVMSRTDNRVTVNLGKKNGIKQDQVITAILLLNLNRHPKFNFIISSEKEVLGKIKITKADDTLSFGQIITEKSIGAIKKGTKISGVDFVKYEGETKENIQASDEQNKKAIFGDRPEEWKPSKPATFGKVGVGLGLGTFSYKTQLNNGTSLEASSSLFPSIRVYGELWLTQKWIMDFELQQGVLSADNPLAGSSPSELSLSASTYSFSGGYNFLFKNNDFFGPSIRIVLGFTNFSTFVDDTSPIALTTTKYSGFFAGLRGFVPLTDDRVWNLGATLDVFLGTSLRETPLSSGSAYDNTINRFSLYGIYQMSTRTRIKGGVEFSFFSTAFSGDGSRPIDASTSSQTASILNGGLEYLF